MSKHTPRPWEMSKPYSGETGGKCVSITGVHTHYYGGVDYNTPTEKADANLIHAAPELAAACVLFLKQLAYDKIKVYPCDDTSPDICEVMEEALFLAGVEVKYDDVL